MTDTSNWPALQECPRIEQEKREQAAAGGKGRAIRLAAALLSAFAIAASLGLTSACGQGAAQPIYAPAAYGQYYGGVWHCYYTPGDPAEAIALTAAGLCHHGWIATPMPLAWQQEYWAYYDSPAYYARFVPRSYRSTYTRSEAAFGRSYRSRIATLSRSATWRSSAGGTFKGSSLGKIRFGSGTSFGSSGSRFGGGPARGGTAGSGGSLSRSGSSGSRSGGFGGGSARSGGFSGSRR